MKKILFILSFILLTAVSFAQVDSVKAAEINKKFDAKQAQLTRQYNDRQKQISEADPVLNRIVGASQQLEIERKEALEGIKQQNNPPKEGIKKGNE